MTGFESLALQCDCAPKILFIGGGNMAGAIIEGSQKSGFLKKEQIAITTRTQTSADKWMSKGYAHVSTTNSGMIDVLGSCIIVLSVKPQFRHEVFNELKRTNFMGVPMVISLMAGIKTPVLQKELAEISYFGPVIRIMPNTPSAVGAGATLIAKTPLANPNLGQIVKKLAESVGMWAEVDESIYNGAAAVASCGPAFVYMFIESLADGGVLAGVPRQQATLLAAQTVMGAAKLLLESGEHPGMLKDMVCSPGGTTIAGVRKLESAGFRSAVIEAVKAAAERADSM